MQRRADESPGSLIRAYRRAARLTQRQLAETARVSIGVVRDLEQGWTVRPRPETVRRLATALGLDWRQAERLLAAVPHSGGTRPAARTAAGAWPPSAARTLTAGRTLMAGRGQQPGGTVGRPSGGASGLRLSVLGPVTAWRHGVLVPLGPGNQRAALGLLALHANTALHRQQLIDALWGDAPPASAVSMIQSYVSRLRRLLAAPRPAGRDGESLITSGSSYRLVADAPEVDQLEFGQLASRAQDAHVAGDLHAACQLYARALDLWQGEPLADLTGLASHPAVTELACQRAEAVLNYSDAAITAGWHDRVLRPLRATYQREPLNERVAARLMIALAGSGCQAAALFVYDEVRRSLDEQLGIYPCAELSAAQAVVLRQEDPSRQARGERRGYAPGGLTLAARPRSGRSDARSPATLRACDCRRPARPGRQTAAAGQRRGVQLPRSTAPTRRAASATAASRSADVSSAVRVRSRARNRSL